MRFKTTKEIVFQAKQITTTQVGEFLVNNGLLTAGKDNNSFICPYHYENTGSLKTKANIPTFKCFGCYETATALQLFTDLLEQKEMGDSIDSLTEEDRIVCKDLYTWKASIILCQHFNLITQDEVNYQLKQLQYGFNSKQCSALDYRLRKNKNSTGIINHYKFNNQFQPSTELNTLEDVIDKVYKEYQKIDIAPTSILNKVFLLLQDSILAVRGRYLNQEDYDHLKFSRKLSDKEIQHNKYFSQPNSSENLLVINELIKRLKANNIDPRVLNSVPGFTFNTRTNSFDLAMMHKKAFNINALDVYGNIIRLQLRTDDEGMKYIWNSDTKKGHCKTPTSTLFPMGYSINDVINKNMPISSFLANLFAKIGIDATNPNRITLTITEGHFKAWELAKSGNNICISMQGITTFCSGLTGISKVIKALQNHGIYVTNVIHAFDTDIKYKKGLLNNVKEMTRILKNHNINSFYLNWDSRYGKGFDDALFASKNYNIFNLIPADEYEEKHDLLLKLIALSYEKTVNKLTQDEISSLYEDLENIDINTLRERVKTIEP